MVNVESFSAQYNDLRGKI